jgi:NAD(P)H dehydrogenase (quinone)
MGLETTLATGMLVDNAGQGAVSYVTREDCAAVAARVLAEGGYEGQRLEVTGPQAVTQRDIAALITEVSGVVVRYYPISDEEAVADLVWHGMSEPVARLFASNGRATREGYTDIVTDVVERVTGRAATSVAEVLARVCPAPVRLPRPRLATDRIGRGRLLERR